MRAPPSPAGPLLAPSPAGPLEVWLASNVFTLVIGAGIILAFALALGPFPAVVRAAFALCGLGLLLFGARVAGQARARRRIYRLLERRFLARGVETEDLRRFLGEPCLVAQAFVLLARWKKLDVWVEALRRFRGEGVLFFAHPTDAIEDELNFPANGDPSTPRG